MIEAGNPLIFRRRTNGSGGLGAGAFVRLVNLVKLVQLKAGPVGGSVFFHPVIDRMQNCRIFCHRPFGVKPNRAAMRMKGQGVGPFFNAIGCLDDQLEFIRQVQAFLQGHGIPFRAQRDPIHLPLDWSRLRRFPSEREGCGFSIGRRGRANCEWLAPRP